MMLNNEYNTVLKGILNMTGYFNMTDLYIKFKKIGIVNRTLIKNIVDDLCDSGHLDYSEIKNDVWAFEVVQN